MSTARYRHDVTVPFDLNQREENAEERRQEGERKRAGREAGRGEKERWAGGGKEIGCQREREKSGERERERKVERNMNG